jgi:hypothetical protein
MLKIDKFLIKQSALTFNKVVQVWCLLLIKKLIWRPAKFTATNKVIGANLAPCKIYCHK